MKLYSVITVTANILFPNPLFPDGCRLWYFLITKRELISLHSRDMIFEHSHIQHQSNLFCKIFQKRLVILNFWKNLNRIYVKHLALFLGEYFSSTSRIPWSGSGGPLYNYYTYMKQDSLLSSIADRKISPTRIVSLTVSYPASSQEVLSYLQKC